MHCLPLPFVFKCPLDFPSTLFPDLAAAPGGAGIERPDLDGRDQCRVRRSRCVRLHPIRGQSGRPHRGRWLWQHRQLHGQYNCTVVEQVTVEFIAPAEEMLRLEIIDVAGRLVTQQTLSAKPGLNRVVLPMGHLAAGIYSLLLRNDRQVAAPLRVVKE